MNTNNTIFVTERAIALNHQNISITEKVCFAASDYLYAEKNTEFAQQNGGLENLKKDFVAFVEQFTSQEPCPFTLFSQAISQLIAANKAFLDLWDYSPQEISAASLLEHFATIQIDAGRLTGKTTYIAHHATGDTIAIVSTIKEKLYLLKINKKANVLTIDELMTNPQETFTTAFIDNPSLVFAISNRQETVKQLSRMGVKSLILLGD